MRQRTENYDGVAETTSSFDGKIIVIDQLEEVTEAVEYLSKQTVLGFDTETRPAFNSAESRTRKVALLQLSDDKRAYLFRLNKIGLPESVCALMANKKIEKIGAAIHDDIRTLNKLTPFNAAGFSDLQKMMADYGIEHKGLKKMAEVVLNINISKGQRLTNWECEKLTDAQQRYAATDAWVCREIFMKLKTMPKKT